MLRLILTFIFIFWLKISSAANCLVLALSSFSNRADVERTVGAKKFWKLYKNDPRFETYLLEKIGESGLEDRYLQILKAQNGNLPNGNQAITSNTSRTVSSTDSTGTLRQQDRTPLETIGNEPTETFAGTTRGDSTTSAGSNGNRQQVNDALVSYDLNKIERELISLAESYDALPNASKDAYKPQGARVHELELSFNTTTLSPNNTIVPTSLTVPGSMHRKVMKYEETVSKIKSGDKISFSGYGSVPKKEFEVGKFIGAGNSTHVFELNKGGTSPGTLIRVPMTADFISHNPRKIIENRVISTDGRFIDHRSPDANVYYPDGRRTPKRTQGIYDKDYTSYRLSWQYVNKRKTSICDPAISKHFASPCYYTVKIISHDPNYRWIEVEKIDVAENYDDFFQKNAQLISLIKENKTDMQILRRFPSLKQENLTQVRKQTKRLRSVKDLAANSGASDFRAAQLAWAKRPDTGEMDWILLDW